MNNFFKSVYDGNDRENDENPRRTVSAGTGERKRPLDESTTERLPTPPSRVGGGSTNEFEPPSKSRMFARPSARKTIPRVRSTGLSSNSVQESPAEPEHPPVNSTERTSPADYSIPYPNDATVASNAGLFIDEHGTNTTRETSNNLRTERGTDRGRLVANYFTSRWGHAGEGYTLATPAHPTNHPPQTYENIYRDDTDTDEESNHSDRGLTESDARDVLNGLFCAVSVSPTDEIMSDVTTSPQQHETRALTDADELSSTLPGYFGERISAINGK
jgi:hypothetical protein